MEPAATRSSGTRSALAGLSTADRVAVISTVSPSSADAGAADSDTVGRDGSSVTVTVTLGAVRRV